MLQFNPSLIPLPEVQIERLRQTEQNPRYHAEGNVLNHTLLVLKKFEEHRHQFDLSHEQEQVLYWAALLHDIGKPVVTRWEGSRWRSPGHEQAGIPIARNILLQQSDLSKAQRRQVLELVKYHSIPMRWGMKKADLATYKRLATCVDLKMLGIFAHFDIDGRICEAKQQVMDLIANFNEQIVPKIEYELGKFDHIQQIYTTANHQKKNALWQALKFDDIRLLEKVFYSSATSVQNPRFTCRITLGCTDRLMKQYIQDTFPNNPCFEPTWTESSTHALHPHEQSKALREVKHFLSVYANASKDVSVLGTHLSIEARKNLSDFARSLGAHIEYVFFENSIDELIPTVKNEKAQQRLIESYQHLDYPHPWEAHRLEIIGPR